MTNIYTKRQYLKAKELIKRRWGIPEEAFNDEEQTVTHHYMFPDGYEEDDTYNIYFDINKIYIHIEDDDPDYELVESLL